MKKDTYFRVYDTHFVNDTKEELLTGTGITDVLKSPNLTGTHIANKIFIGTPGENDIDICRGGVCILGPNTHASRPGVSNITAKGGLDGLLIIGNFGTLEWGQYSNYDRWFKVQPSTGLRFSPDACGKVTVWFAEPPRYAPQGVKVKVIWRPLVLAYFLWRSVCQTILPP